MAWNYLSQIFLGGHTEQGTPFKGVVGTGGQFSPGVMAGTISSLMEAIGEYQAGRMAAKDLEYMSDVYYGQAGGHKLTKALLRLRKATIGLERGRARVDALDKWIHKFGSSRAKMARAGIDISDHDPGGIPIMIATALIGGAIEEERDINLAFDLREFNEVTLPKHMAKMEQINKRMQADLYSLEAKTAKEVAKVGAIGGIVSKTFAGIAGSLGGTGGGIRISERPRRAGVGITEEYP